MLKKDKTSNSTPTSKVADYYSDGGLKKKIQNAIKEAGLDLETLTIEDLAAVDEFHIGGKEATKEMVQKLDLEPTDSVLDVGSGIGGTARFIAKQRKSQVTGLDLTPEFIEVSKWLDKQVKLDKPPSFVQGDATDLPFEENTFDAVLTEHVNMNIEDKEIFVGEMYRVVKKGGQVFFYEILTGPNSPVEFPVPWSETKDTSFLASPVEIKSLFEEAGFTVVSWEDTTPKAEAWYKKLVERNKKEGPPPIGLHLILGEKAPEMFKNLGKNLREERIKVVQVLLQK